MHCSYVSFALSHGIVSSYFQGEKRSLTPKDKRKPSASSSRPDSKSTTGKPEKGKEEFPSTHFTEAA